MTEQNAIEFDNESKKFFLKGDLTFDTVNQFLQQSETVFEQHENLNVDLNDINRSDSAGLALIIYWIREARRNNRNIMFYNMPVQMLMIAKASGLDQLIPVQ